MAHGSRDLLIANVIALSDLNRAALIIGGRPTSTALHDARSTLLAFRLLADQVLQDAFTIVERALPPLSEPDADANATIQKREFIAQLLTAGSALPSVLALEIARGFTALNHGEVHPLFERAATGQHGNAASLDDLKRKAVWHVMFLFGQGIKKGEAREIVSRAIPYGVDALVAWEKAQRAKEKRSNSVGSLLRAAESAGRLQAEYLRSGSIPVSDDRTALALRHHLTAELDLPALAAAFRLVTHAGADTVSKRRRPRRSIVTPEPS
jgi:hypothetical protein